MITANDIKMRATIVFKVRGIPENIKILCCLKKMMKYTIIPKIGTLNTAVMINSRAEAKAFKIELSFFRKRLVTMPRIELLIIKTSTNGLLIDWRDESVNAEKSSPCKL